jgi:hypothetical protein
LNLIWHYEYNSLRFCGHRIAPDSPCRPGFHSRQGQGRYCFLFTITSMKTLGSTQPPL